MFRPGYRPHKPVPVEGSIRSRATGLPADGTDPDTYPLTATCEECAEELTTTGQQIEYWVHREVGAVPTPRPGG